MPEPSKCKMCKGSGKRECPGCYGIGKKWIALEPEYGKSFVCPECRGKGKADCPNCDGKGEVTNGLHESEG